MNSIAGQEIAAQEIAAGGTNSAAGQERAVVIATATEWGEDRTYGNSATATDG